MRAWARTNENIYVEDRTGNQPCQAVCAAVCACHGLLTFEVEDYSFNADKFINFLEGLRGALSVGDEKLYVFLDNCRVHHAIITRPHWERLNMEPVWNIAYSPEYNSAIERFWGQLKAAFRPRLLQRMLACPRARDTPLRDTVFEVLRSAPTESIPSFVASGLATLERDALAIEEQRDLPEGEEEIKKPKEV